MKHRRAIHRRPSAPQTGCAPLHGAHPVFYRMLIALSSREWFHPSSSQSRPPCTGTAHDTRKGRRRHTFRLPCAYLWLSPPSARSARRLRLLTIRFEQNPPAGWPSSSAAVLRSGRSVRRRRRTAGWQAKQHAIEEHGYESCLRRQLAHHHRRGRAADACCSGRRQNRAGSSR